MGYRETGIVEIVCRAADGSKVIYRNQEKMQDFVMPPACEKVTYITGSETAREFDARLLQKIESREQLNLSEKAEERKYNELIRKNGRNRIKYCMGDEDPLLVYTDITETEMFGFPEITKTLLRDSNIGLWAYHGIRKLKFTMSHLVGRDDGWIISAILYFNKKDNDEIPEIRMDQFNYIMKKKQEMEDNTYELYVYVDTNKFGSEFNDNRQRLLFSGYLEMSFTNEAPEINDVIYCFPVELCVNNTNYDAERKLCVPLQTNTVSIDFGTSSSCVAIKGSRGIELLTLSVEEEGQEDVNIYENPTCVMIYRWQEIYHQWRQDNQNFPLIVKGNLNEEKQKEKAVQYDFGYSVKSYMHEVSDKELNSIITEIKMVPKLLQEQKQITVRPFVEQDKKTIKLVDSYEEQDEESLDVVALYGYILGKAINRIEKNKIYTKYQVTYPVKFNEAVKQKLRASLEYGLKRSIPLPLREAVDKKGRPIFKVETKYPEPVAYIGAMCGKYLKIDKSNPKAQMFAVFDFGGGTLDYSFGIFALDHDDPNNSIIYILGVDGDSNIGGEALIKKMSYWIYTSPTNISQFVEKRIPFEQPIGEVLPDNCPQELFYSTVSAKSNMRKINEQITRGIFEGKSDSHLVLEEQEQPILKNTEEDATNAERDKTQESVGKRRSFKVVSKGKVQLIEFLNSDDNTEIIEVSFDDKELNEQLERILRKAVSAFKSSMKRAFTGKEDIFKQCGIDAFRMEDVHIFKAGNSSRNQILSKIMKAEFEGNDNILLVDETSSELMSEIKSQNGDIMETRQKQVAITPKTAVACGQLRLSEYEKHFYGKEKCVFNWYVGRIDGATNEFQIVIDKVNLNSNWQRYKSINNLDMRIHYAETCVKDGDDRNLKNVEIGDDLDEECLKKYLYIKIKDSDTLLCCVCERNHQPDDLCSTFDVRLQ